jgi:cation:H+ antiporter
MFDFLAVFFLIIGLILLFKGGDMLVEGSISIAKKLNVSDFVIGLTLVAVGTSFPELFVSIVSNNHNLADLLVGNILGSSIANILLILGLSAFLTKIYLPHNLIWREIPFSALAVIVFFIMANDFIFLNGSNNFISVSDGLILLIFYLIFLYYIFSEDKSKNILPSFSTPKHPLPIALFVAFIGSVFLYLGAEFTINGASNIARALGISEKFIGLSIVAIGTSLPELITSLVSLFKRNHNILVGNVVGSNIANIFFVLGLSASLKSIPYNPSANIDVFMAFVASFVLFLAMIFNKKSFLSRFEGTLFLIIYILYLLSYFI